MAEILVRKLTKNSPEDQVEQAVEVLSSAFLEADDPFSKSLIGINAEQKLDSELNKELNRTGVQAGLVGGEVWVAGLGPTDSILAVGVWFGPGADFLATKEQRAAGWDEFHVKFSEGLKQWWLDYMRAYNTWNESCLDTEKGSRVNSWQLALLGTSPKHHRKGLASALIRAIELKATANGEGMCLETTTDSNVAFYEKRGFEVRGTTEFSGSGGKTTMTCLSKS
ncbi:hypothetical protein DFH06DRAFT_1307420 [Mycena polygramma]|nr:hypothetical protein DFH06DRAFT_1307420 [Mycena polygramma]